VYEILKVAGSRRRLDFRLERNQTGRSAKEEQMNTEGFVAGVFRVVRGATVIVLVFAVLIGSSQQTYAKQPFSLIYLDGHMHTTYSDGSGTVAEIKTMALARGLDAVIITNHCKSLTREKWNSLVAETAAASDASFLALPGFEVTGSDGMFNRDHINAWGVNDPFVGDDSKELCPEEVWESPPNPEGTGPMYPENLTKWVDYIHSKQGIAVHNHPSGTTRLDYGVKHMEVYNQSHVDDVIGYATALGYPPEQAWKLGLTFNNFALYGERDVNMLVPFPGFPTPIPLRYGLWYATANLIPPYVGQWLGSPEAPLNSWDQLLMAYVDGEVEEPIFALADSDSHNTGDLTCDNQNGCSTVGVAKNGVYVKALNAKELYKAIKAGRSFATTGPSLNLDVNGEWMGDTAEIEDGTATINLAVNSESPTAILVKIDIIRNGVVWQTINPMSPFYQATLPDNNVTEDGYYRVEVTSLDLASGKYFFAWSNPVFVKVR
jgi:hypothetical protein